jgi:hypothetical protein
LRRGSVRRDHLASVLLPMKWEQLRSGHWAIEHFLTYFMAALIVYVGWRRPNAGDDGDSEELSQRLKSTLAKGRSTPATAGFLATGVWPPRAGQFCTAATIIAHGVER